jgi:hypothetical protein
MDQLTNEQRLQYIVDMISRAKQNVARGGSFQILLWGYVIAVANFGHYALEKAGFNAPYAVWLIVLPALVVSIWHNYRMKKESLVTGYLDKVYGLVWLAALIAMVTTLAFMWKLNFNHNPIILLYAGIATFVTGILLRFRPVIAGAAMLWVGAVAGFMLPVAEQYLVGGIAIVLGYIVPGTLLKKAERG